MLYTLNEGLINMYNHYNNELDHNPTILWLNRHMNDKEYAYNYLDELMDIYLNNLPSNDYYKNSLTKSVLSHIKKALPASEVELTEEYYNQCFPHVVRKYMKHDYNFLDILIYLESTSYGKKILCQNGFDLSKNDNYFRGRIFDKTLENIIRWDKSHSSTFLVWEKQHNEYLQQLIDYKPKQFNHKNILDKYLCLTTATFIQQNNIELSPKHINALLTNITHKVLITDSNLNGGGYLYAHLKNMDYYIVQFNNIVLNTEVFKNTVGPTQKYKVALYHLLDKQFKLPEDIELAKNETMDNNYILNEFSKRIYDYAPYQAINLQHKHQQKINIKFSGQAFVIAEQSLQNIIEEDKNKKTSFRRKI